MYHQNIHTYVTVWQQIINTTSMIQEIIQPTLTDGIVLLYSANLCKTHFLENTMLLSVHVGHESYVIPFLLLCYITFQNLSCKLHGKYVVLLYLSLVVRYCCHLSSCEIILKYKKVCFKHEDFATMIKITYVIIWFSANKQEKT